MFLNAYNAILTWCAGDLGCDSSGRISWRNSNLRRRTVDHDIYFPIPILGFLNGANVIA